MTKTTNQRLPDPACVVPHHRRIGLAMEGVAELRHIRGDSIHAPLAWGMGIHSYPHSRELVGAVVAPHVRPAQEEALLGGQAINSLAQQMAWKGDEQN